MIENVHCRKDCPNRAAGCHTTCADGAAEMLVNSISATKSASGEGRSRATRAECSSCS